MTTPSHNAPATGDHPTGAHEERDVTFRPIVLAGIGFFIVAALVFAAMVGLFDVLSEREARLSPPQNPLAEQLGPQLPPEPRLQSDPRGDLLRLREREKEVLTTYGWVDRQAGVVRIPIERAMQLLAERGLPSSASGNSGGGPP